MTETHSRNLSLSQHMQKVQQISIITIKVYVGRDQRSCATPGPVSTWRVNVLARENHLAAEPTTQVCSTWSSLVGMRNEYQLKPVSKQAH